MRSERSSPSGLSFTGSGLRRRLAGSGSLQLCGQLVKACIDAVDVMAARDAQPPQRALDRFVDHAFQVTPPPLHLVDQVGGNVEGFADVVEQRLAAFLDSPWINEARGPSLLLVQDDLRKDHLRQVLTRLAVDDLDLVPVAHELGDALESYVAAGPRVIKLAIRILLDKVTLGRSVQCAPILTRCVMATHGNFGGGWSMATRKRASTRDQLLKRAVKAGRKALRSAEKRVPPDLRKHIEKSVEDGQKTVHAAIKRVQTQLDRTARQADLDKVLKRLEAISKQVQQVARAAATAATAEPTPKKAVRKPATRKPAARKPAAARAARTKAPASRRPASRRTASRSSTAVRSVPPPPEPGPVPERIDSGETST